VRSARAVEDLQRKELEDQLEAEAYFSGLYKTQVLPVLPGISGLQLEDQMEAEAYFSGLYKTQVHPVTPISYVFPDPVPVPGSVGPPRPCSGRSWRISWRPRPTSPAYTRPRYSQPLHLVFFSGSGSPIRFPNKIPFSPVKKVHQNILKIKLFSFLICFFQEKNGDFLTVKES
jgi:hypothetical protein